MRTLTRDEARRRAELLQVSSYDVALELDGGERFTSTCAVRFTCREPGATTFLELDGELLRLERGGAVVADPVVHGNRIELADLAAEEHVVVTARCTTSTTGEGLHRSVDPADGEVYLYGQSFLDDAQRVFACFDQPDLKAAYALTVRAPAGWTVLSTGRAQVQDGVHVFAPTPPISTYLMVVVAGPWHGVREVRDGIELGVWCRQSLAAVLPARELLDVTAACFALQQEVFGRPYPFGDTYAQVFVPEFNAGAMENPGVVTFADEAFLPRGRTTSGRRRLRAQVVAHEMAHMWFGDLVTMRWWDDLWLNEAFAEYLGVHTVDRATDHEGSWADFCTARKAWGYRADQLPTTHPVAGDVADNRAALLNFDGISYAKGASALRQLSALLGEDVFFAGVRRYLAAHAHGNTSLADLLAALEAESGRDLQGWARAWLRTAGVGLLRVVDGVLEQSAPLRPHRVGVGAYDLVDGRLQLRERVEVEIEGERLPLDLGPADLLLPNDGDLTFSRIRLDARSLATARTSLGTLADPLARALVWAALWDAARDGELPAADLVAAVLAGVDAEHDPEVVTTLLGQARTAARLYTRDGEDLLAALHAASAERTGRDPGSDLQLVHARAAAESAAAPDLLRAWYDGRDLPAGLVVDTDLRWLLVRRLAALGALGSNELEAELQRDPTAGGALQAAAALAALPDPGVKQQVWDELVGEGPLTNARARALSGAFWQPGQDALLAPYVERWAAQAPRLYERRTPALATDVAELLFPRTVVAQRVLDLTAPLLEGDLPPGLRRAVLEGRDDVERALRARAAAPA